jgi:hypothetical protein
MFMSKYSDVEIIRIQIVEVDKIWFWLIQS